MSSPTEKTLAHLREKGYYLWCVERYIKQAGRFGKKIDLFHIIDYIAIKKGEVVGVQSTGTDFLGHDKKLMGEQRDNTVAWLESGAKLVLYGWRKVKEKRGGKRMIYKPRIKWYSLEDFDEA